MSASVGADAAYSQVCPPGAFLRHGQYVYAGERVPGTGPLARGGVLGRGVIDQPVGDDPCRRERRDVRIVGLDGIDPGVAVGVEARPGSIFVLGNRCAGYEGSDRRRCLLEPLEREGVAYTGTRYPEGEGSVPLGDELGEATLGGEPVRVRRIEGVDPSVAVGIEGRPAEAFLAPGICPYERFADEPTRDDLSRCLRAPLWLVFDPPGAQVGIEVIARADRPLAPALADATIELVRLRLAIDVVPQDFSGAFALGAVESELRFDTPELEQGIYEAVIRCEACAGDFGGRTVFPAGSILVLEEEEGSSIGKIVAFLLGGAFVIALVASILVWRRGRLRRQ